MRYAVILTLLFAGSAEANELTAKFVERDLAKPDPTAKVWSDVPVLVVNLMAQPMVVPRPKITTTASVRVQALHDGRHLAIRLQWKDGTRDEAGRLGQYSDAAAVQFPMMAGDAPPPVMMGAKGAPVHIFHWRAQYQRDKEKGKPTMQDLYPNMTVDQYPLEFADHGKLAAVSEQAKEQYSPGVAVGNPQSYSKTGVDEIVAEGFSTSSVMEGHGSLAEAVWHDGEWILVITRQLTVEGGSTLTAGKRSYVAFAIWQGSEGEVGSRKAVTMSWTPVLLEGATP